MGFPAAPLGPGAHQLFGCYGAHVASSELRTWYRGTIQETSDSAEGG
jgi:hypothetical protein